MRKLAIILFWIFSLIAILLLTIGIFLFIGFIQQELFIPKEYLMWVIKYPAVKLVIIYEVFLFFFFVYLYKKLFRKTDNAAADSMNSFYRRHKKLFLSTFLAVNIVLLYTIVTAVTVITNNKIIDHSFFSPLGKDYSYNDIAEINAGVYGKRSYTHSKGDFFYIIKLKDGTAIDLTDVGSIGNEEHESFIIEKLDIHLVNMNIPKVSSMENFEYTTEHLDKMYTDKIRNILENTR